MVEKPQYIQSYAGQCPNRVVPSQQSITSSSENNIQELFRTKMESNITAILTQKRSYNTCCMLLGSRNVAIHY